MYTILLHSGIPIHNPPTKNFVHNNWHSSAYNGPSGQRDHLLVEQPTFIKENNLTRIKKVYSNK